MLVMVAVCLVGGCFCVALILWFVWVCAWYTLSFWCVDCI